MGRVKIRWMAFPAAYYATNAVWQGYMSLFYRNLGFAEGKIGAISAATALCALLAQPAWGKLGDGSGKKRRLLGLLALASALALLPALVKADFVWQLGFAGVFYAFYCGLLPMGDAVLLDGLNREGRPFGPYRLAGAVSFALVGAAFGRLLGKTGPKAIVLCTAALLLLAAASTLLLPENAVRRQGKPMFRELFRDRRLMGLLCFMVPVQMTMGYFHTFFATHFSALPGANSTLLGLSYAVATLGEVPYLLLSDRIFARYGAARPMCVSALVLTVKWLLTGFSRNACLAVFGQLLHGGGFIVMSVSMAKYIAKNVEEHLRASGQMLLSMASFGIARVAGNLGGGFLAERIGSANVFYVAAGLCFVSLCLFAPKAFRRKS